MAYDGLDIPYNTQDDIKEIVQYAADNCITVIPEVCMFHSSFSLCLNVFTKR